MSYIRCSMFVDYCINGSLLLKDSIFLFKCRYFFVVSFFLAGISGESVLMLLN